MESVYGDEEFMDEGILEASYENPFRPHQEQVFSPLDESETKQDSNDDFKNVVDILEEQENKQRICNEETKLTDDSLQQSSQIFRNKNDHSSCLAFPSSAQFLIHEKYSDFQN